MPRRKETILAGAALLCSACMALGLLAEAGGAGASEAIRVDFETTTVGELPAGFSTAVTGGGRPAEWRVVDDATAPSGGKVLAQTSTAKTSYRFPLCIFDRLAAKDVEVSVTFKPVSGTVDQAAGLVARYRDKDNYYIVRANALEDNVRLYKVERGNRQQFAGANVKVPSGEWQTLALEVKGTHFRVLLNDALLFEADDATFKSAGRVGLWTKADSVTYFDDLRVKTGVTR
ncbi:MAG: family 16 glycoside hydrolase [Candidatus Entotheonellia bacterium]